MGERGGNAGVDREVAMQAGRSQELRDRGARGGEEHLAAEQPGTPLRADQDGQPSLVAGRNAGQVDNQRARAAMKHVDQAFPQFLGGREVERTAQPDDTAAGPDGSRTADGGADAGHDDPGPTAAKMAGARSRLPALAARSMAATASCSPVRRGSVTRSVRWPLAKIAVSSPAGMLGNQPSRMTRPPAGSPTRTRRGLLASPSAVPSMTPATRSCRFSRAGISPRNST